MDMTLPCGCTSHEGGCTKAMRPTNPQSIALELFLAEAGETKSFIMALRVEAFRTGWSMANESNAELRRLRDANGDLHTEVQDKKRWEEYLTKGLTELADMKNWQDCSGHCDGEPDSGQHWHWTGPETDSPSDYANRIIHPEEYVG